MADNKLIPLIKALGQPSAADITTAVDAWLNDHPEATTTVQDGSITKAKLDSNLQGTVDDVADLKSAMETKAEQDGSYDSMTVGNAEQLVSTVGVDDKTPYLFRTTGGSADVGDRVKLSEITGGTVAWNQIVYTTGDWSVSDNGSGTRSGNNVTVKPTTANKTYAAAAASPVKYYYPIGHKFFIYYKVTEMSANVTKAGVGFNSNITFIEAPGEKAYIKNSTSNYVVVQAVISGSSNLATTEYAVFSAAMCIDLTLLFGSTIADYIYSLEQATAGAGVAFFRNLFPKPYYAYDAGSLISVKTTGHKEVGFNQWDEEWEEGSINATTGEPVSASGCLRSKNFIPVVPGNTYFLHVPVTALLYCYDINKNYIDYHLGGSVLSAYTLTMASNCYYVKFRTSSAYGGTYKNDICFNLHWDGERDGEYEPYEEHSYPLDSDLVLRGIPKLDANNNLYYDGDEYASDGTVTRKYGIVDLGTLTWKEVKDGVYKSAGLVGTVKEPIGSNGVANIVCEKYMKASYATLYADSVDKTIAVIWSASDAHGQVWVRDSAYTDAATFKTAMSGVYLVYELATPTTESADPYQETQVCNDFGTEEFIDTRTVPIPVGTVSRYQANLRAKLEMAPDSPADGDGDYIVRQTNGENAYVKLVIPTELPTSPTTDGSYHLKCTVASGTATLSWESDT